MTNSVAACLTGGVLAASELASGAGVIESITNLGGLGVLVWIAVRQGKEIDKLRELVRESYRKCGDCVLARAANNNLIEAVEHESEDKSNTEKSGRGC